MPPLHDPRLPRRGLLIGTAAVSAAGMAAGHAAPSQPVPSAAFPRHPENPAMASVSFTVNGEARQVELDTRTTLLDALRNKKGLPALDGEAVSYLAHKEAAYDRLAELVRANLDMELVRRVMGLER